MIFYLPFQYFRMENNLTIKKLSPPSTLTLGGDNESREPGRTRTCDRLLRRQMLYPAELRVRTKPLKRIVVSCLSLTGPLRILLWLCREDRTRTCDPLVPNQMRYHLRHFPNIIMNFSSRKDWDSNPGDAFATTA